MASELTVVTGVAGFVGAAVVRALAARGRKLRGIVRGSSDRTNLADFPGELAIADLRDAEQVREAMAGASELYHVAADYRVWAPDPEDIVRNNLVMTQAVMDAALGPLASPETRQALARAESRSQGLALLLMSPEFQRR